MSNAKFWKGIPGRENYTCKGLDSNSDPLGDKGIKTTMTIMKLKIFLNTGSLKHLKSFLIKRCKMFLSKIQSMTQLIKVEQPFIALHSAIISHFIDSTVQIIFV